MHSIGKPPGHGALREPSNDKPRTAFSGICRSSPDRRNCLATGPHPKPSHIGSAVGPYRLTGRLGRGGMSSVWVAERIDGMLNRRVAVKLPHVSWAMPSCSPRMGRERDLLASLEHPNIARLYDAGVGGDGRPFLALELVDGQPIDEFCAGREADVATRVDLILQTAKGRGLCAFALDRAPRPETYQHPGRRRRHRCACSISASPNYWIPTPRPPATKRNSAGRLFTPDYASPEQIRGEAVTAGTDVFSLGVVLYQLLCSQLPFPLSRVGRYRARRARAPRVLAAISTPSFRRRSRNPPSNDIPR